MPTWKLSRRAETLQKDVRHGAVTTDTRESALRHMRQVTGLDLVAKDMVRVRTEEPSANPRRIRAAPAETGVALLSKDVETRPEAAD